MKRLSSLLFSLVLSLTKGCCPLINHNSFTLSLPPTTSSQQAQTSSSTQLNSFTLQYSQKPTHHISSISPTMFSLSDLTKNPSCHLPSSLNAYLPSQLACPPPSLPLTIFTRIASPITTTYTIIHHSLNTLIGLPFLSFLLIPATTSYSTSLNLLFFYLTWSTLVLSHPPLRLLLTSTLFIRLLFYLLPSLSMLTLDLLFPRLASSLKRHNRTSLPLLRSSTTSRLKFISWSTFNIFLSIACQGFLEYFYHEIFARRAIRVNTTLPLPWGIAKDLLKGFLARDLLSWIVHRVLHQPPRNSLSRDLSRLHLQWYHGKVSSPFPLSASYEHPVVYLLRVFLPMYLPAMVFRFHALTWMMYVVVVSLEEMLTHSGYSRLPTNFVVSLPFSYSCPILDVHYLGSIIVVSGLVQSGCEMTVEWRFL